MHWHVYKPFVEHMNSGTYERSSKNKSIAWFEMKGGGGGWWIWMRWGIADKYDGIDEDSDDGDAD